jgi:hypothetical protein
MSCDPANIPTVEANLRNIQFPLSADDYNFLLGVDANGTQVGVDFFANNAVGGNPFDPRAFSRSPGIVRSGLRFRTDFILDSMCIQVHCEPNSWALDGNQFRPQATINTAGQLPSSPDQVWEGGLGAPLNAVAGLNRCNAQLEWGGPTWRAASWFLQAYRIAMQCPSSANINEIFNERLVDLGNCCLGTKHEGYGTSQGSEIFGIRVVNARLNALRAAAQMQPIAANGTNINGIITATDDIGYFVPFNCTDAPQFTGGATGNPVRRTFQRMYVKDTNYGNMDVSPDAQKWFRLPVPRVLKRDENIEIVLKCDPNDLDFQTRMFMEMSAHAAVAQCMSPVPGANVTAIPLGDGTYTCLANAGYVRIPGGVMRIGIALKGWILDANLCGSIKTRFDNMSLAEFRKTAVGAARNVGAPLIEIPAGSGASLGDIVTGGCGCGR